LRNFPSPRGILRFPCQSAITDHFHFSRSSLIDSGFA
jgi:hypothetical protein